MKERQGKSREMSKSKKILKADDDDNIYHSLLQPIAFSHNSSTVLFSYVNLFHMNQSIITFELYQEIKWRCIPYN